MFDGWSLRRIVFLFEHAVALLFEKIGITDFVRRRNQSVGRVPIVTYHSVHSGSPPRSLQEAGMTLSQDRFLEHLAAFQSRYEPMSLAEYFRARKLDPDAASRAVVLTFDDGLLDNYEIARILESRGLKGSFFLIGRHLDGELASLPALYARNDELEAGVIPQEVLQQDRYIAIGGGERARSELRESMKVQMRGSLSDRYMTNAMAQQLRAWNHDVGVHGYDHVLLCQLSDKELDAELRLAKRSFSKVFPDDASPLFAYPYGMAGTNRERERVAIQQHGFRCALSTEESLASAQSDTFGFPRIQIDDVSAAVVLFRLSGMRGWLKVPWQRWLWSRRLHRASKTSGSVP